MSNSEHRPYGAQYEAQARIISKLQQHVKDQSERANRFEDKYYDIVNDATFYRLMIEAIQQHETLQTEWGNFIALLRLCEPDLENKMKQKIKGL